MDEVIKQLPKLAQEKHNENKKFFGKLRKKPPKDLDYIMQDLHEAAASTPAPTQGVHLPDTEGG